MKLIKLIFLSFFLAAPVVQLNVVALDTEMQLKHPITQLQLLQLLQAQKKPPISFKRGLKIAEGLMDVGRTTNCHLFEGRLVVADRAEQEPNWQFWWFCPEEHRGSSKYVGITVSMRGKAQVIKEP